MRREREGVIKFDRNDDHYDDDGDGHNEGGCRDINDEFRYWRNGQLDIDETDGVNRINSDLNSDGDDISHNCRRLER